MNRRSFLAASAGALAYAAGSRAASATPPNILWLISEDISPDIGCYGNSLVQTATQGTRYEAAFATCPVCSPARSALMTGMYQTSIGVHNHRSHRDDNYHLPAPVKVITSYFRAAGYFVSNGNGTKWDKGGKTDWNFTPEEKPFDGTDWRQRKPRCSSDSKTMGWPTTPS